MQFGRAHGYSEIFGSVPRPYSLVLNFMNPQVLESKPLIKAIPKGDFLGV